MKNYEYQQFRCDDCTFFVEVYDDRVIMFENGVKYGIYGNELK